MTYKLKLRSNKANALNASATIFEVLSDIDSKFAKYTDKEYDAISTEVRKWFKKLAVSVLSRPIALVALEGLWQQKEEKAHDERLSSANARIKQAGVQLLPGYLEMQSDWCQRSVV